MKIAGIRRKLETYFSDDVVFVPDFLEHLKIAYDKKSIEKDPMKTRYLEEMKTASDVPVEKSGFVGDRVVCISVGKKELLVFNDVATLNLLKVIDNVEIQGSWVFRIDSNNQIESILYEMQDLGYAELYGVSNMFDSFSDSEDNNRDGLEENIEDLQTDNLQIKKIKIESESG